MVITNKTKNSKLIKLNLEGESMVPILKTEDETYYQLISFKKVKVSEIILVKKNTIVLTHRVIYKTNRYLITKGDNNIESDGKIYPSNIIGRVVRIKRGGEFFNPDNLYLIQSTLYFQEIIKLKKAFDRAKIDYVFLKGLPLHLYYEKIHPRRIYLDCDVMISQKQLITAIRILKQKGFKEIKKSLSEIHKRLKNREVELTYTKTINEFTVTFDVHLEPVFMMTELGMLNELYSGELINQLTKEFIDTKRKVKINNESFFILNSKFLILYLALHFFHHNWRGAFRLELLDKVIREEMARQLTENRRRLRNRMTDIRQLSNFRLRNISPTSHNSLLFSDLASLINQYRLQNYVYPSFYLVKKLYNTPIPRFFLNSIKPLHPYTLTPLHLNKINVFNDLPRTQAGIERFKLLYHLSPNPWYRKIWVFVKPIVVYKILWVAYKRLFTWYKRIKV